MSLTEFDQDEYDRNRREEGREEGALETARKMLVDGLSVEMIEKYTSLSSDAILNLQKEVA